MTSTESFKEQHPDLHKRIMVLNADLAAVGADLSVALPGSEPKEPIPAPVVNLLDVQVPSGDVAKAQLVALLKDGLTGLGFLLTAAGIAKPQLLSSLLSPEGQIFIGAAIVFARRCWAWWQANHQAIENAREKIVALHLRNVRPDGQPTTLEDVKRVTAQRVEVAQAAKIAGVTL